MQLDHLSRRYRHRSGGVHDIAADTPRSTTTGIQRSISPHGERTKSTFFYALHFCHYGYSFASIDEPNYCLLYFC